MIKRIVAVLLGVWLGAQLTVGYVVAPVLFAQLPKMTAGHIAGTLFGVLSYFGLLVWALAWYVGRCKQERSFLKSHSLKWIGLLWVLVAAGQWLVTPVINALKSGGGNWLLSLTSGNGLAVALADKNSEYYASLFAWWHGMASIIYLLVSLIGLYLVVKLLRFEWH